MDRPRIGEDVSSGDIVFLGDSLTAWGDWPVLLDRSGLINMGIPGDTTAGILARSHRAAALEPEKLFLMAGANDLFLGTSVPVIAENYRKILQYIKETSPRTRVYVQSVLPVNNRMLGFGLANRDIIALNKNLRKMASEPGLVYVDLHPLLSGPDGRLRRNSPWTGCI